MRSEFGFLRHLKNHFNLSRIGDDCAILPKDDQSDFLITSDLIVEDIDFRLEWTTPKHIGHKVLAVSLSDVAAMGGIPRYSMLSISIPESLWKTDFLDRFYEGYYERAMTFDRFHLPGPPRVVELIGGDISKADGKLTIDSTVVGEVPKGKAILRSGAKPGDKIFVTGSLGNAAFGLRLLEQGHRLDGEKKSKKGKTLRYSVIHRQLSGFSANGHQFLDIASSMIDLSDGLSSDLVHICEASGVGARLFAGKIPFIGYKGPEGSIDGLKRSDFLELALHGGEDFELLFTVPPEYVSRLENSFCEQIGEITDSVGAVELIRNGTREELKPEGFTHFP